MKLNKFVLVSILLLAVISLGAVSAASDATADDSAVGVTEELDLATSDVGEISADGDDIALGSDANYDEDVLSAGSVTPNYTIEVSPNVTDAGGNYVAQYGQVIKVSGIFENVTGNISIKFGYSGNEHDFDVPLVDGKFSQDITCYDRVRNNYQIQVNYAGDDYYKPVSWSKNIHVQMENVTANGAYYGLDAYMDINMFDATGNVTCIVNDEKNYTGKLENGKLYIEIENYTLGENTVDFIYSGDDRFNPIEKSFTFDVDANIRAPAIFNHEKAIVEVNFGDATGKATIALGNETHELDIVDGKVTTEIENYKLGNNTLDITYSGDSTFNPFKTTAILTVLDKEDATIISSVYQTASQNFIFINIPHATGNITVTVNGKEEEWELVDAVAKKDIAPSDAINELKVSYAGNYRLNPTNSSFYVNLTDYVVNDKTFRNYFDLSNDGKLYDFLEDGITLDFQGVVFVNPKTENEVNIEISKPINIISSTNDAYIDLNTTAGSLLGEHPGSSFIVGRAGSGSNISGIYLHNTELWISNTTNVVFDNISVVVEDQRVGSGVGATSVRDNSSYVTIKNSYFYTRNNGGSTTFTFSWATYSVFDNNTVKVEGNVGNLLYLNVYNIKNLPGPKKGSGSDVVPAYPLNNHNAFTNNRLYGKEGSAISVGIMVEGEYNLIANNTLNKTSIGTSFGCTGPNHNTYYGNILMEGSSFTAQTESIVYDNYVPGTLSTGANSTAYDNLAGKMAVGANSTAYDNIVDEMTVNGAGATAYDNLINTTATVSGSNVLFSNNAVGLGSLKVTGKEDEIYYNTIYGVVSITGANTIFKQNNVTDVVTVSSNGNAIYFNEINATGDYAIDLTSSSGNNVTYNFLYADELYGDDAVKFVEGQGNIVKDNYPLDPELQVTVDDINLGEVAIINISMDGNITDDVLVVVDGKLYVVPVSAGKGQLNVSDLVASIYTVAVMYKGDEEYAQSIKYAEFTVYIYVTQFTNITIENNKITAYLFDDIGNAVGNAPIVCFINGVESNATTAADGSVVISDVAAGSTVALIFEGKIPLLPATITIKMNVTPSERTATQLFAEDFKQYACDYAAGEKGGYFKVQIKDANGKPLANKTIAVGFNGVVGYYQSDAEGWIEKQIALASAGEYTFASIFLGDENYTASFIVNKITIVKKPTSISASAKSYKASASKKSYTATLKTIAGSSIDGKVYLSAGKKITFKVNGKTYTAKTDSKGKATVNLKLTKKGKYTVKVSFAGDNTYKASSKSVKITIK